MLASVQGLTNFQRYAESRVCVTTDLASEKLFEVERLMIEYVLGKGPSRDSDFFAGGACATPDQSFVRCDREALGVFYRENIDPDLKMDD